MAMMPELTQVSLAKRHHQPLFADRGTVASVLHHLPSAILHTSARAPLAIIVLRIFPGIRLANRVPSLNGHTSLLFVLAASPGDCERFECV